MVLALLATAVGAAPASGTEVYITSSNQATELVDALRMPGTVVRVGNHVRMDLSNRESIEIQQGVQLLGGRSSTQAGPLLFTRTRPQVLFAVRGDDVRISGLRIRGPDYGIPDTAAIRRGIQSKGTLELEIDHNEISGFEGMGVELQDASNRYPTFGLPRVRVHDNFIHHNRSYGRDGYGVQVKDGAFAWIERNVFDYNRHAIEGDGDPRTGYLAYDNLVLRGGGEHRRVPIYGWFYTHQFDMHGTHTCFPGHLNCGSGGHHIDIRYNAFWYTNGVAVKIRGTPAVNPCGATVYYNTFRHSSIGSAVQSTQSEPRDRLCAPRAANQLGFNFRVRACLIDGDNQLDNFLPTGRHWWYQHSRQMHWTFIRRTTEVPANCPAPPPPPPPPGEIPPAPPPQPPATGPAPAPDLTISSFTLEQYTVTNQGNASAGPFRVSVVSGTSTTDHSYQGLGPGQSATMPYTRGCELREVRADTLNQVSESNENNTLAGPIGPEFC
jgi:hypothetical protein